MSSTLDQSALPAERMIAYPLSRQEAACAKWAIRMKVQLSKYGVAYVLASADGSEWADRWPELKQLHSPCVPVNNTVSANTFCRCDAFTDQSNETYHEWGGVLANNTEVSCD